MKRIISLLTLLAPLTAHAGGMFLPGRGARALARAGSFVAGADDGGALYYNPAGLAEIQGVSLLLDGALILQQVHYARVDSGGNMLPALDGSMDLLPIPTLVLTWKPKQVPWLTVAGGVWVPYLGLNSWPADGPQRYSTITLKGSLILVLELAAAFKLNEHVFIGAGFQDLIMKFKSTRNLSACTELNCAPEDQSFDSPTQVTASTFFTPSANAGLTIAYPKWRFGLSVQAPFVVHADSSVQSKLPTDPMFANAVLVGDSATTSFTVPLMIRAGFELRPIHGLRVEAGVDYEAWSMQDRFTIQPHNIYIDNVPGIGRYYLNTMYIERHLTDSVSVHIGGEMEAINNRLWVRAGYLFESSATPDQYASVFAPDGLKNMIALGVGARLFGPVRIDVSYAHVFFNDRSVDWKASKSLQTNPIQPSLEVGVGGGDYHMAADILAAGLDGRF
jgi:long-chain fatty acid transport protein